MRVLGRELCPRAFLTLLNYARHALFGQLDAERRLAAALCNDPGFIAYMSRYMLDVPQGRVDDRTVTNVGLVDLRRELGAGLSGEGLELGALHNPMPVSPAARVRYVDRASHDALLAAHPEVAHHGPIVVPDIVTDAETLEGVADQAYDFLIASHLIEHLPRPLGALAAWVRVLKPGGRIYLVVPDKRATFDAHRVRTTLEHHVLDYEAPSADRDFEHYVEYARFVHGKRGREAIAEARRLRDERFSLHYHVFMPSDVVQLIDWFSTHVHPVAIERGPLMAADSMEFHVLVRKGG